MEEILIINPAIITEKTNIRSAKRSKNERLGLHNWHPYYAGYSEAFVEDMLEIFEADIHSNVLDPWIGSGTTSIVCQKRGIPSFGVDINPAMVTFGRAKCARLLEHDLNGLSQQIIDNLINRETDLHEEMILSYINLEDYVQLKAIQNSVNCVVNTAVKTRYTNIENYLKAFFYSVLFKCIREIGHFRNGSNPTWLHTTEPALSSNNIRSIFMKISQAMINDLNNAFNHLDLSNVPLPIIECGDSKALPFKDNYMDYIITSPPYLTRIDYAISTKPELLFMGFHENEEFDSIRRSTMGAPVIADKRISISKEWGIICNSFLNDVKLHKSKAACSYYLPLYLQYFRDAYESLKETKRVLKPGSVACLVVQTSFFKEIEIRLNDIYVEMGRNLGLGASILQSNTIRQHMAHVNSKSNEYIGNKTYYEDYILFEKRKFNGRI